MFKKIASLLLLILILGLPLISSAAIVNCGNTVSVSNGNIVGACTFKDFTGLLESFVDWLIGIAGVIFTISAIWGGFLYMTSGENPSNKDKAKTILKSTLSGFIIILCAWLIVYTFVDFLAAPDQKKSILKFLVK